MQQSARICDLGCGNAEGTKLVDDLFSLARAGPAAQVLVDRVVAFAATGKRVYDLPLEGQDLS